MSDGRLPRIATPHDLRALLTPVAVDGMHDAFRMPSMALPDHGVFGGQVIGQAAAAAMRTVDAGRVLHSLHGYFLRAGDTRRPIVYRVERLRDGHSFSARRIEAYQDEVPIFSAIGSFQVPAADLDHSEPMPEGVGDPEELPRLAEQLRGEDDIVGRFWADEPPFDMRISPWPHRDQHEVDARSAVWMRANQQLPDDEDLHRAAIGFLSDYALLQPIFRRHGLHRLGAGYRVASLDHAIWWHRPARADDWLLYVQHTPTAVGARGLATATLYDRTGTLVASSAQEGMLRRHRVPQTATPDHASG